MKIVVQQWGNSLALRIPKAVANEASIKKGNSVTLWVEDGSMVLQPLQRRS